MELAQERAGDVVIVRLAGRFDGSSAGPAEEGFMRVLAADGAAATGVPPHLAIDLSQVDYVSSAGLRVLLVVTKAARQADRQVVLCGLVPTVREIFSISAFDQILAIYDDPASAVAAIAAGAAAPAQGLPGEPAPASLER
jgi:anti-anti-sigma factor